MCVTEDSALVIEVKSTRQELEQNLKELQPSTWGAARERETFM